MRITDKFLQEQYDLVRAKGCIVEESQIRFNGQYYRSNHRIVISSRLPNHKKLTALQHEFGHHCCYKFKCGCLTPTHVNTELTETHAIVFSLKQLLSGPFEKSIFSEMKRVCLYLSCYDSKDSNVKMVSKACRNAASHPVWDKCMSLLGGKLFDWIEFKGETVKEMVYPYIVNWPDINAGSGC